MHFLHHGISQKIANHALAIPRLYKRCLVMMVDLMLCWITIYLAFYLRLGFWVLPSNSEFFIPLVLAGVIATILAIPVFYFSGLYLEIFRYSGLPALRALIWAILIYGLIFAAIFTIYGLVGVPRTIGLIQPILLLLAIGGIRAFANIWLGGAYISILKQADIPNILIYGAGDSGRQLAAGILQSREMRLSGFLDDDPDLIGSVISGLPIYTPERIKALVNDLKITHVLLALPSLGRSKRNEVIKKISIPKLKVQTLPGLMDLAHGRISLNDLKELDIDDLLQREIVGPDETLMLKNVAGHVVMVTGAGGSIGSELCRQLVKLQPLSLILFEHSEHALYQISEELKIKLENVSNTSSPKVKIVDVLGSVTDAHALKNVLSHYRPSVIYHAAAYKHVPIVEDNPFQGIKNNVFGTALLAKLAASYDVQSFVLVSTDKAVRPTNIMGASKRLAEMVLQAMSNTGTKTIFSMVRFGNVLASSGSVIPKFRTQIQMGGPVTVTDFNMERYFMTITEASQLVIQAGSMANGGEVFLLDMGAPVLIYDLAKKMIEASGLEVRDINNPSGDIEIIENGLRPGEKLYEELLISGKPEVTKHPSIYRANEESQSYKVMEQILLKLESNLDSGNREELKKLLLEYVDGYRPTSLN